MKQLTWNFNLSCFLLLLTSCDQTIDITPKRPKQLTITEENIFGNVVASLNTRAWGAHWKLAKQEFSSLSFSSTVMESDKDWRQLKKYYEMQLNDKQGWRWDARFEYPDTYYAWSFARVRNSEILVVVGLRASHQEGNKVPVNIMTNLKPY